MAKEEAEKESAKRENSPSVKINQQGKQFVEENFRRGKIFVT